MSRLLSTLAGWGRSFASLFTIARMAIIDQWALVAAFSVSIAIAYRGWDTGVQNWKADATLRYLDKLNDREYVDYLWDLEAFTLCFEQTYKTPERETKGRHISYSKRNGLSRGRGAVESDDLTGNW